MTGKNSLGIYLAIHFSRMVLCIMRLWTVSTSECAKALIHLCQYCQIPVGTRKGIGPLCHYCQISSPLLLRVLSSESFSSESGLWLFPSPVKYTCTIRVAQCCPLACGIHLLLLHQCLQCYHNPNCHLKFLMPIVVCPISLGFFFCFSTVFNRVSLAL